MAILVTGAAGFIGARFVENCRGRNLPVVSVDDPAYFSSRTEHQGVDFGRVVDRNSLFEWLKSERPALDAVVHLGACTDTTELNEEYLNRVNLEYSKSIWSWCAQNQVPLVYASSAATYGDGAQGYDDDEAKIPNLRPLNPYGESKQRFDLWALDQERKGVTPPRWSGFKFFNVYGFGERHKGKMASVVLHAFDQIQASGGLKLFKSHKAGIADGHQKRDFIHVDDVNAVLEFARAGGKVERGIFNLGTGRARTFLDLGRSVFRELGRPENITFIDTPVEIRGRYQYFTEARMEKIRAQGYPAPFASLEEGIHRYVQLLSRGPRLSRGAGPGGTSGA